MSDEQKENNPFEPPETDSKPRIEQATLRGDHLGALACRISLKVKILIVIGSFFSLILIPWASDIGTIFLILWILTEVIAILIAIVSFFSPASSRKAAYSALLLSGCTLAVVIGIYFEILFLE